MTNLLARAHPDDWIPATDLVSGARLEELFALPERLWAAPAHAAAVLAWKAYTYRLIQPLAKAWTSARQLPVLSADNVRFRVRPSAPYIILELRHQDPTTLPNDQNRLDFLRDTLIDGHLRPLMERTRESRRISERVLWGQAAAAIAYSFADHSPVTTGAATTDGPCTGASTGTATATSAVDCAQLTELLPIPGLAGIGEDDAVWQTTCCLAFTSPGLTACRTCVTATRPRNKLRAFARAGR